MDRVIRLKTFKATLNGVSATGELPTRLKLFDWGSNKTSQGDFLVDEGTVAVFAANQGRLQRQTVAVDFNHNTVEDTPAYLAAKGSPEIAGYGVPVIIPGQGIFLEKTETTPSGLKLAADYKDLSPAPLVDSDNRVIGLHSVALVPAGATEGLTIESAALKALSASLKTLAVPPTKLMGEKPKVNAYANGESENNTGIMEETKKAVLTALGGDEDMSYEDVCAKLKPMFSKSGGNGGPLNSPAPGTEIVERCLTAALPAALGAAIAPLTAKITALETTLNAERASLQERERASIIADASKAGKVIPLSADEIKTLDTKVLASMVANLPKAVVPMKALAPRVLSTDGKPVRKTLADSAAAIEAQLHRN